MNGKKVRRIAATAFTLGALSLGAFAFTPGNPAMASAAAPASVASPATVYNVSVDGFQGQLDTQPGNGYASWIWGYNPTGSTGWVQYQYYGASGNTPSGSVYIPPYGGTRSANFTSPIWRIRICYVYAINSRGEAYYAYSNWS